MSKLIVEVCRIERVDPHPNADRMAIATVKGWKTCVRFDPETGTSQFSPGDKCVFFPPDSVLPPELANSPDDEPPGRLSVAQYLQPLPREEDGVRPAGGRVRATRLRGEPSYGLIVELNEAFGDDPSWPVGTDVAEHYGVVKYEPPPERSDGEALPHHPGFPHYTSIENLRNFPSVFEPGEEVVVTEKIHGANGRIGLVWDDSSDEPSWSWMAGSHSVRRKEFDDKGRRSDYWMPLGDAARSLLTYLRDEHPWHEMKRGVVLFGEIYGAGVQDMDYGRKKGDLSFRAFDLSINDSYLDFDAKTELFARFGIESVPVLFRGPYSPDTIEDLASGPTTVCEEGDIRSRFKGREGVVVTPVKERFAAELNDRLIVKAISADYLARKGGTERH